MKKAVRPRRTRHVADRALEAIAVEDFDPGRVNVTFVVGIGYTITYDLILFLITELYCDFDKVQFLKICTVLFFI